MQPSTQNEKEKSAAGAAGEHLSVFFTSVELACPPHALTQLRLARSHARTTQTRNETETDFLMNSPESPIPRHTRVYCRYA